MHLSRIGIVALTCLATSMAVAHEIVYTATLSGPAEAPPNTSPGVGTCTVTVDLDLATMRVQAEFSGLTGNTSACHIHGPTANPGTGTAGVMTQLPSFIGFPLGVTAGTYDSTFDLTLASSYSAAFINASGGTVSGAMNRLLNALADGKAYLNIHSTTFGGGEIRGFLQVVPPCIGDYNDDQGVDGDDVIAFFADWDQNILEADVNGDEAVDGDDVITFFGAWDAGC